MVEATEDKKKDRRPPSFFSTDPQGDMEKYEEIEKERLRESFIQGGIEARLTPTESNRLFEAYYRTQQGDLSDVEMLDSMKALIDGSVILGADLGPGELGGNLGQLQRIARAQRSVEEISRLKEQSKSGKETLYDILGKALTIGGIAAGVPVAVVGGSMFGGMSNRMRADREGKYDKMLGEELELLFDSPSAAVQRQQENKFQQALQIMADWIKSDNRFVNLTPTQHDELAVVKMTEMGFADSFSPEEFQRLLSMTRGFKYDPSMRGEEIYREVEQLSRGFDEYKKELGRKPSNNEAIQFIENTAFSDDAKKRVLQLQGYGFGKRPPEVMEEEKAPPVPVKAEDVVDERLTGEQVDAATEIFGRTINQMRDVYSNFPTEHLRTPVKGLPPDLRKKIDDVAESYIKVPDRPIFKESRKSQIESFMLPEEDANKIEMQRMQLQEKESTYQKGRRAMIAVKSAISSKEIPFGIRSSITESFRSAVRALKGGDIENAKTQIEHAFGSAVASQKLDVKEKDLEEISSGMIEGPVLSRQREDIKSMHPELYYFVTDSISEWALNNSGYSGDNRYTEKGELTTQERNNNWLFDGVPNASPVEMTNRIIDNIIDNIQLFGKKNEKGNAYIEFQTPNVGKSWVIDLLDNHWFLYTSKTDIGQRRPYTPFYTQTLEREKKRYRIKVFKEDFNLPDIRNVNAIPGKITNLRDSFEETASQELKDFMLYVSDALGVGTTPNAQRR